LITGLLLKLRGLLEPSSVRTSLGVPKMDLGTSSGEGRWGVSLVGETWREGAADDDASLSKFSTNMLSDPWREVRWVEGAVVSRSELREIALEEVDPLRLRSASGWDRSEEAEGERLNRASMLGMSAAGRVVGEVKGG
jgi:hypothetical protein